MKLSRNNKYAKFIAVSSICALSFVFLYNIVNYKDATRFVPNGNRDKADLLGQTQQAVGNLVPKPIGVGKQDEATAREYDYNDVNVFVSQIFDLMADFKPTNNAGKEHGPECTLETLRADPDYEGPIYSKDYLSKCLRVNYNVYEDLKKKHSNFLKNLPTQFPDTMFEGRGIVMVGGAHYTMLGYLVIRILRERGTKLPIEVFMPPGTNDEYYCKEIMPKYNAKCVGLDRVVDTSVIQNLDVKGYQLKSLAFLASSFNEMLYIDSDNYPLYDVNDIFENEPFTSHGMILWPDFWRRATSPAYYDIAGIELGKQVRFGVDTVTNPKIFESMQLDLDREVSLHDREGTVPESTGESSAIFLNKKTHIKTMLLSMYYNVYGPNNYYSLLSQDTFGEGDKETFGAAANAVGEPYWQVKTRAQPGGALLHDGKRPRSTTMLQYNPMVDYQLYKELKETLGNAKQTTYDKMRVPQFYNSHNKNVSFVHYNLGKLEPLGMIGWNRRYGYDLTDIGFDFELENVKLMVEMFCQEPKMQFEYIATHERLDRACQESTNLYERMSSTAGKVITDKAKLDKLEPFSNI